MGTYEDFLKRHSGQQSNNVKTGSGSSYDNFLSRHNQPGSTTSTAQPKKLNIFSLAFSKDNPIIPKSPLGFLFNPNALQAEKEASKKIITSPQAQNFFDVLSRPNYASANTASKIVAGKFSEIPGAIGSGLSGKEKGSYIDVVNQIAPNAPKAVKIGVGLLGDMGLDPTTYLGNGLTKLGKLQEISKGLKGLEVFNDAQKVNDIQKLLKSGKTAEEIAQKTGATAEAIDLLQKSNLTFKGKTARDVIKGAQKGLITGEGLTGSLSQQAAKGERGLINVAGHSLIPKKVNSLFYSGVEKGQQFAKNQPALKSIWDIFNTKPLGPNEAEAKVFQLNNQRKNAINFGNQEAQDLGKKLIKDADVLKKKYNLNDSQLLDIIEKKTSGERRYKIADMKLGAQPGTSSYEKTGTFMDMIDRLKKKKLVSSLPANTPQDLLDFRKKFLDLNRANIKAENAAGINTNVLWDPSMNYLHRVMTKENKESAKMAEPFLTGGFPVVNTKAGYQKQRKLTGILTSQVEKNGKKLFIQNAPVSQAIRNAAGSKVISNAEFLNKIIEDPKLAYKVQNLNVPSGSIIPKGALNNPPAGFREVMLPSFWDKGQLKFYDPYHGKTKGVLFDPAAADAIEKVFIPKQKTALQQTLEPFTKLYDKAANWWKSRALASPGTVFRNFVSNPMNMAYGGTYFTPGNIKDTLSLIAKKDGQIIDKLGRKYSLKDLDLASRKLGVRGTGQYTGDIEQTLQEALQKPSLFQRLNPLGGKNYLVKGTRKLNEGAEDFGRTLLFVDQIKKGHSPEEAAQIVDKLLFNYTDLTDAMRSGKRAMPFLTWTRKNVPLQVANVFKQPGKIATVPKVIRSAQYGNEQLPQEAVSPWMAENLPVNLGRGADKNFRAFLLKNWMPQGDLLDVVDPGQAIRKPIEMVSPFIKAPLEVGANWNTTFNSPIEKRPNEMQNYLGMTLPKKLVYLLRSDRIINELDKYNPFGIFGGKRASHTEVDPGQAAASYLTGGKIYPVDAAKGLNWSARDLRDQINVLTSSIKYYQTEINKNPDQDNRSYYKNIQDAMQQRAKLIEDLRRVTSMYNQELQIQGK